MSATTCGPFNLSPSSPLPSQSVSLSIVDNKVPIIDILCNGLSESFQKDVAPRKLAITGSDPVPYQIERGICTRQLDLTVTHEEADIIIANQVVHIAR